MKKLILESGFDMEYFNIDKITHDIFKYNAQQDNARNNEEFDKIQKRKDVLIQILEFLFNDKSKVDVYLTIKKTLKYNP